MQVKIFSAVCLEQKDKTITLGSSTIQKSDLLTLQEILPSVAADCTQKTDLFLSFVMLLIFKEKLGW